jgi:hypothetical protein
VGKYAGEREMDREGGGEVKEIEREVVENCRSR